MSKVELLLPKMGESVAEATITSWLIQEGDKVEAEDGVLEIATDKVDSEVPCTVDGIIVKQLYKVGDVVPIGAAVAIIECEGSENEEPTNTVNHSNETAPEQTIVEEIPLPKEITEHNSPSTSNGNINFEESPRFYSPLVKSIAKKEAIDIKGLDQIPGTGKNNRLTKNDLLSYLKNRTSAPTPKETAPATTHATKQINTPELEASPVQEVSPVAQPASSVTGNSDIIEMDRMRKLIANNMLKSKQISPHVTSMIEIDVTNVVAWRNKVKDEFFKKEGVKLTFTPLFVEAVAKALRDFPMVNISIDGDKIIVKKDINIGMAVALPSGNLIVPVVKNADQLNLIGLAKRVGDLTTKARNNKLDFNDISGGTFTLTNIGTFGNAIGTPIINQPEVAIMSTGVIQKKPAVIETPQGDTIGIRQMMFLSMSYDHRVVDGMLGGSFLRRVADYLEKFDFNRQIW